MHHRKPWILGAILLLAVLLRGALGILHPFWFPDSADYDSLARACAHGLSYQVNGLMASRMPGYPLLLAAVYALLGPSVRAVLILQALMGGLSTYLVYLLARRISEPVALLAALLAALDPLSIGFSAALLSEASFTLLLLLALWILLRWSDTGRFAWSILLGLTWAAAVYMRASALWCIVPLAAWILVAGARQQKRLPALAGALLALAIVLLSLLPWQIRNYALFHEGFFRLTTLEGISLYEAVYPQADGGPKQDLIPLPADMTPLNEAQRNDEWTRRARRDILADPLRIALLALRKIGRTWSPWLNAADFRSPAVQLLMIAWHIPLFVLALLGIFKSTTPLPLKGILLIPILYFTAVHALFLGSVRYRVPLMPLLCIFAAIGLAELRKRPHPAKLLPERGV